MPVRIFMDTHGPDVSALRSALIGATDRAKATGREVVLVVPVKSGVDATVLSNVITRQAIGRLVKGELLTLYGAPLRLESAKTIKRCSTRGVIVALYPSVDMLDDLDKLTEIESIIILPWVKGECDAWRDRWQATVIQPNAKPQASGPA